MLFCYYFEELIIKPMSYFKYILLASLLVLTGAGCGLQQPEPIEDTSKDTTASQALKAENDRLKKENEKLKKETEQQEKEEESKEEEDSSMEEKESEENMEDEKDSTDPKGRKVVGEVEMEADDSSIIVLLTTDLPYSKDDAYIEYGCDSVLVPVKVELEKSMSDLATAVVELLTIKRDEYSKLGLENSWAGLGLTLANVSYEDGKRIIEFEGEPKLSGVCEDARIQAQLEETIKLYSENFEIRLNGSAQDWDDLFNLAG